MAVKHSFNPWGAIWVKPRRTIRTIVDTNPSHHLLYLSAICGFPILLYMAQLFSLGNICPTWVILVVSALLSPIAGYFGIAIWSGLLSWTGRWIKGKGNYKAIRAAVAWSYVPNLVNVLVWIVVAALLGSMLFQVEMISQHWSTTIQLVASVWALVIMVISVSEVQKFSVLRAISNILISCILLTVMLWILNSIVLRMIQG